MIKSIIHYKTVNQTHYIYQNTHNINCYLDKWTDRCSRRHISTNLYSCTIYLVFGCISLFIHGSFSDAYIKISTFVSHFWVSHVYTFPYLVAHEYLNFGIYGPNQTSSYLSFYQMTVANPYRFSVSINESSEIVFLDNFNYYFYRF